MKEKRICRKCNEEKLLELFVYNPLCKKNREWECKMCRINYVRKRYNSIHGRAQKLYTDTLNRSLAKGRDHDLTVEWIEDKLRNGVCEETGIKLDLNTFGRERRHIYNAPSLDKVNPDGGYTMDNVKMTCLIYNIAKGEYTKEVLYNFCKELVKHFEIL